MKPMFLYITASDLVEAETIGRHLVEERLVACVNILEGMRSIYRWQGSIHEDREVVLLAKTREDLVEAATQRVLELHSYDCPCIVALPIEGGNPAYLDWINKETQSESS